MNFYFLTLFPQSMEPYTQTSILGRAAKNNKVSYFFVNPRDFTDDSHRTVDDIPYGGGPGMVMKVEPIFRAVESIQTKNQETHTILLSAKGKRFSQKDASRLTQKKNLVFICGRYQGVDERVAEYVADEEMSIGDYVLTGGELPALVICDSIVRLLPGVLGNIQSLEKESHSESLEATYPLYTRPETFQGWNVPKVLLGGNHADIEKWRKEHSISTLTKEE